MDNYYSFEMFLQEFARNYKHLRYQTDIMYRAKMFNQYQRSYKYFVKDKGLIGNYDDVQDEIRKYEKRITDSMY